MKLRAAVIGLGVGERHIAGYESDPRCKVVSLCDIDPAKLEAVGRRYPQCSLTNDPTMVLSDPEVDVVSIASYDNAHHGQILCAINNGKHVFVEKPLCQFRDEFEEIAQSLSENPQIRLSSNLILRRTPRFSSLREKLARGQLGELYYVEGSYNYGRLSKITSGWRAEIPYYSVVQGGAIHLIDLILWLSKGVVDEVHAFGNKISSADTEFRSPDLVAALLRFRGGKVAKITANFGSVTPHSHELKIFGTKGSFIHGLTGAAYFWSRDPSMPPEPVLDAYPGVQKGDMLPSFVRHILDGSAPDVSAQEVFDAMAVALAIDESLSNKAPAHVQYVNASFREKREQHRI